uniref:Uncharacterized protein n=1 Tax=Anguilla anguilla TaxID=7936 RepID=A0A0E9USM3_ANGAN
MTGVLYAEVLHQAMKRLFLFPQSAFNRFNIK